MVLGREFVAEVDAALDKVANNPLQYQVVYRDIRRAQTHRFPYGVFYRIEQRKIMVFAIVHLHRDEASWRDRLK